MKKPTKGGLTLVAIVAFLVCYFTIVPHIITYYGRKYHWEGFGTVPFSENYSVLCLLFIGIHAIGIPIIYAFYNLITYKSEDHEY